MINDSGVPLISFTGSTAWAATWPRPSRQRFGRSILELGGNNAIIVEPDADLDLALRAVALRARSAPPASAAPRLRRLFLHDVDRRRGASSKLVKAYRHRPIGDPLDDGMLMGPLVNEAPVDDHLAAIETSQGAGRRDPLRRRPSRSSRVLRRADHRQGHAEHMPIACDETFAPILYVFEVRRPRRGHRASTTRSTRACRPRSSPPACTRPRRFLSHEGSDCGIANVNIGTSGAEIGGAFGGEKETGGGREAGSDAWKAYMRRQTCTINWSDELPLAQGVSFDVD